MNEQQWSSTIDFNAMMAIVRPRASDRQLRLLACGHARQRWRELSPEARRVVETAEHFADDPGALAPLTEAVQALREAPEGPRQRNASRVEAEAAARRCAADDPGTSFPNYAYMSEDYARALCDIVRDLFGNPFRPPQLDLSWLAFEGGTVVKLARGIYQDRAWERMPILADALEDAGCSEQAILDHLRGPGTHFRGCWVLELLTEGRPFAVDVPEGLVLPRIARPRAAWSVVFTSRYSSARPPLKEDDLTHRIDSPAEGSREVILAGEWSPEKWQKSKTVESINRVWLFIQDELLPLPSKPRGQLVETPDGPMLVYAEGEEESAWQDLARSCPALAVLLPLRRSGPMPARRLVTRILAGEDALLPKLAELLEAAGSPRAAAVRKLVGPAPAPAPHPAPAPAPVPTPAPTSTATPKGDDELEKARKAEADRPCPGCGDVKGRRVLRVQKEGANKGRLFVKCFACQRFDWLDESKPAKASRAAKPAVDTELLRRQQNPPLCINDCGRVEVGRVQKEGRNKGRLYTRCPECGAFCWQS